MTKGSEELADHDPQPRKKDMGPWSYPPLRSELLIVFICFHVM